MPQRDWLLDFWWWEVVKGLMWRVPGALGRWLIAYVRTSHYICVDPAEMRILPVTVWSSAFFFLSGKHPIFRNCGLAPHYSSQGWESLCFDPVSRPRCLPRRLICGSGCLWCRRLLNVSFGPSAWFSLPLFLFIYLVYQFVTQMNNGWGRLLPRWHAKLIIVMCLLAKSDPLPSLLPHLSLTPPPPLLDDGRVDTLARSCAQADEDEEGRPQVNDVEIHTHNTVHTALVRDPKSIFVYL